MNKDIYKPILIYNDIFWDLTSEACHILLIAPSGAGKTLFLCYLAAMVLKRGNARIRHRIFLIDGKNTSLHATFKSVGIDTATTPNEIIKMLTYLVNEMEKRYAEVFNSENIGLDTNFSDFDLPAYVLIFDEVLSVLDSGSKQENTEMIRLLKLLSLKGRMAGFAIVLTSQRILATDLPKSITEQCQTRFLMGANISEELYHVTLGGYKKDLASGYHGGVGKGYAITPKTGLTYFEAPYMDFSKINFKELLEKLVHKNNE
ncbi:MULTISPECIES: FtsK/SpoIIIE domain-containing protein [Lactococcus]|uniref:FtsK/SpoIIIE domain-containing protein n=1 Tax=Lactococcus TaxID=1357 RepID=UPI0007AE7713|nr:MULTISPECIES: FtsK/SpoIIIE domain-containing protein [Lactococcus]MDU8931468.1 DNA translocase FtsK [Lactococcus cremoris]UBU73265.1 AAA family ATPase [Lactococcus lactis]